MKPFLLPFGLKPKEKKADDGPRYADIYERAMAMAIDVSLLFLVLRRPFEYMTVYFYRQTDRGLIQQAQQAQTGVESLQLAWASGFPQLWLLNAGFQLTVMGLFFIGCQIAWKATPGKWLFGLSIRRRSDLGEVEMWRHVLRYIALLPSAPLFFWMSFNKQRRGLHDVIAGTVVIHTRPKGWYWEQVKRLWRKLRGQPGLPPTME